MCEGVPAKEGFALLEICLFKKKYYFSICTENSGIISVLVSKTFKSYSSAVSYTVYSHLTSAREDLIHFPKLNLPLQCLAMHAPEDA